ncbi:MAG TPA: putative DNA binding domain-containing protein [Saprospiraceae bacterium]|nr:putative DNA binding domain-containing protein [Saprospiraceae bacterium]MCB9328788.1 putative DNA binding domain-containing protein [Lewinellaceae bacterium]HRX28867.1 putative DNA binding domain-containing protein [Saprospiraceae bacterium]
MIEVLNNLLSLTTENEVVEFKEAKNQFDKNKLGQYFSALSNEANLKGKPNAWMVLGVRNDKSVVGTSINDHQINEYKAEMANHTSPKLSFIDVHSVKYKGLDVLLFEIPAAPQGTAVSWKGHRYGRDGESLGGLNDYELKQIQSQIEKADWSVQIIEHATLDDLSTEAITMARKQFTEKNPKLKEEIHTWDNATFLNKAKVCINGKITNTAILLLGKPESEHFISPATAKISWILKDRDNIEKDYEHFTCPLLLEVENVKAKIRNLKYRYIKDGTLFPDEVDQYDPYIVREALNNCIAHQDYTLGGKINVVEHEDGRLTFANSGTFIPESIEKVIETDAPETNYRNPFLANAMVNLNMIDTIGSGIKKMFVIQKNKYFPLPDYDTSNHKVQVNIIGKVLDINYARKIAQMPDLSLEEIMLLDKLAKQKVLTDSEISSLKSKKLIEGRKPNFHISSSVATATGQKADYIKQRGFKDTHYKQMILDFITEYGSASKNDIDKLLLDILPKILDEKQKANKVRNIVYAMSRKDKTIENEGTIRYPKWIKSLSN